MEKVTARAPARVDLAGGSLDLWPLGLAVEGALTVNVAIDLPAEVTCVRRTGKLRLVSEDYGADYEWAPGQARGPLPLLERFCERWAVGSGWEIRTSAGSPPGAGLGGSSALSVALAKALGTVAGTPCEGARLVATCRDLEAVLLGIPTGVQDFWPALLGGALAIRYIPGEDLVEELEAPLEALGGRMVVAYSGRSRLSSSTNWEMMKRFIDGDAETRGALEGVAAAAREAREHLVRGDMDALARAVGEEWIHRKRLAPGVATPELDRLEASARGAGALGCKACGAGGGGCMVFIAAEGMREAVAEALAAGGAQVLHSAPADRGCSVEVIP